MSRISNEVLQSHTRSYIETVEAAKRYIESIPEQTETDPNLEYHLARALGHLKLADGALLRRLQDLRRKGGSK